MKDRLPWSFGKYVSLNVLGMLGLSCYILADTYFIANGIGANGLASLNLAIAVYSFIHGTGLMVGIGGATWYTIQNSSSNSKNRSQTFTATVQLGLLIGLVYLLIGLFLSEPLARLLGADANILPMTAIYLRTILAFAPCFIANNVLIAFVRNDGSPKTAMAGMLTGSFSNILLDYVFIFPFAMGMFGAALATGLAPIISMAAMSVYFVRKKNRFHLQKVERGYRVWAKICSLGASAFVTEIASGIVLIVFNLLLLQLSGNTAVAAYGVVANLSLVAIAVYTGIGQGIQPLVSHHYGAGNLGNVRRLLRYSILLSSTLAAVLYAIIVSSAGNIVDLFNRDNDALLKVIATEGLSIYFVGFFFAGVNVVLSAYFSAIEKARTGFSISILRGLIVIVPLAIILSAFWGIDGIWLTFPLAEAIVFLFAAVQTRHEYLPGRYGV